MDFFDEDDAPPEEGTPRRSGHDRGSAGSARSEEPASASHGADRPSQQQIRTRQLTFIGGAIVVLILLVLAVRGCLEARQERAFKNYVSDLSAVVSESQQLSQGFFGALQGTTEGGEISLGNQVNSDRGTASALADRAANLDAPDEIASAQQQVTLAFEYRAAALATISEQLPAAQGDQGARRAQRRIAEQMEVFLASDVAYRMAREEIQQALTDEEIVVEGGVPESSFLPTGQNQPDYLDEGEVGGLIAGSAGGAGGGGVDCDPGDDLVHGLGLTSVAASPSGVALTPDTTNTLAAIDTELTATVQNQGEADETEVEVTIEGDFTGSQTIPSIAAGVEETVTIPLRPTPTSGDSGSLTVTAQPVCGEEVADNNSLSYELVFE